MAFKPINVPLLGGGDSGSADLAAGQAPQELLSAQNVVFTKGGAIRGRPGAASCDGSVVLFDGTVPASGTSIATALGTYQVAGLLSYNENGTPITLLQCHGRLFKRNAAEWVDVGPCWSVKRTTQATLLTVQGQSPTTGLASLWPGWGPYTFDAGATIANVRSGVGGTGAGGTGVSVYNPDGTFRGAASGTSHYNAATGLNPICASVAGDVLFYLCSPGDVDQQIMMQTQGTFPAVTEVAVATNCRSWNNGNTDSTCQLMWAATDGTNYYLAYITNNTLVATIKKLSPSGTTLGSLSYSIAANNGSALNSVSLAVDAATSLGHLVVTCDVSAGTTRVRSYIFNTSTMTDSAIEYDPAGVTVATQVGACAGIHAGVGYLAWCDPPGRRVGATATCNTNIQARLMTSATSIGAITLAGMAGNSGFGLGQGFGGMFRTLFPFQVLNGRVVMGIAAAQVTTGGATTAAWGTAVGPWTWYVIDVTFPPGGSTGLNPAVPVASGLVGATVQPQRCGSANVTNGVLRFGAVEGVSFQEQTTGNAAVIDIQTAAARVLALAPQAAPYAQVDDQLVIGGNLTYIYDGRWCAESGFVEGAPFFTAIPAGGGALTGAYSFQVVWTATDGTGRKVRGPASNILTVTAASNANIGLSIEMPQLSVKTGAWLPGGLTAITAEVYAAGPNPVSGQALTLAGVFSSTSPGSFTYTGSNTATAQSYVTGGVLDDDHVPSDRGVVTVNGRIWCADEHNLYPSHTANTVTSPAWNLEEFVIPVPPVFGKILGLGTFNDSVIAICENGVVSVNGPGFDDTGTVGQGWSTPQGVFPLGGAGPARAVASAPGGVYWIGPDGLVYFLSMAGQAQCIGTPVRANAETGCDLVYVPPMASVGQDTASNPLLVYGTATLKALDLVTGQWSLWVPPQSAVAMTGAATGLEIAVAATPYVLQFKTADGSDLGSPFAMSIRSAPRATTDDGLKLTWGRVRSINPVFDTLGTHTLTVQAYADEARAQIMSKVAVVSTTAEAPNWPFSRLPEFRTSIQRCGFLEVAMSATPALAEWTALEIWADDSQDRAPARVRAQGSPQWTVDATKGWAIPQSATEWAAFLGNSFGPVSAWNLSAATDLIGACPMSTNTGFSTGVSIPGWTTLGISVALGSSGVFGVPQTLPPVGDPFSSFVFLFDVYLPSAGAGAGQMFTWGGFQSARAVGINGAGQLTYAVNDGSNAAVGVQSVYLGTSTPMAFVCNRAAGFAGIITPTETVLQTPYAAPLLGSTTLLAFFGDVGVGSPATSTAMSLPYAASIQGAAAERFVTPAAVQALLTRIKNGA